MSPEQGIFLILALTILGLGFWYLFRKQNAIAKARQQRFDAVNRLIEKFAAPKDIAEFLQTEQGKKLLEDRVPAAGNPRRRLLRLIQAGVVFLLLGPAFWLNAYWLRNETSIHDVIRAKDLQFWGTFWLALGAGLLIAAFLTDVFIRKWELNGGRANVER